MYPIVILGGGRLVLRMWRTCNAVSRVIREFSKNISNLPASKSRRRITSEWAIRQNAALLGLVEAELEYTRPQLAAKNGNSC